MNAAPFVVVGNVVVDPDVLEKPALLRSQGKPVGGDIVYNVPENLDAVGVLIPGIYVDAYGIGMMHVVSENLSIGRAVLGGYSFLLAVVNEIIFNLETICATY
jgi:hypothetical protein